MAAARLLETPQNVTPRCARRQASACTVPCSQRGAPMAAEFGLLLKRSVRPQTLRGR